MFWKLNQEDLKQKMPEDVISSIQTPSSMHVALLGVTPYILKHMKIGSHMWMHDMKNLVTISPVCRGLGPERGKND